MTDNRNAGLALILGSLGSILTMAIHPHGSGPLPPAILDHLVIASGFAHTLAIISAIAVVLGACGLTLRLAAQDHPAAPNRLAISALVVYFFAAFAIMIAAAISGFIIPNLMRRMAHEIPTAAATWEIVIVAIFQINQAFSSIYTVAASTAMALWSLAALRSNAILSRALARYGCIIAPIIIAAIFSGHLRLNVHGMTLVVLAQAIWFITAGVQLRRTISQPIAQ